MKEGMKEGNTVRVASGPFIPNDIFTGKSKVIEQQLQTQKGEQSSSPQELEWA